MSGSRISAAARSERGGRENNEDALAILQDGRLWLAVLADGAGGHRDGAEASRRVVAQFDATLHRAAPPFEAGSLTRAVLAANASVREDGASTGADAMHSTVVALWLDAAVGALWSHVGDSRLYRARRDRVECLTVDDSVVQHLLDAGLLTPAQAAAHPSRNQLVAALGMAGDELRPHTLAAATPLEEGDAYLLCSDGWWGALDELGIAEALAQSTSPDDWLDAMRRRIEAGAGPRQDNFSAIGVWIGDASQVTRPRRPTSGI